MFQSDFWGVMGQVFTIIAGAVGVAYALFRYFGKKWLDNLFEEKSLALQHQQELQMEQYRFEINSLFNRIIKVHEKEFEVLPLMWFKLQEALGKVMNLTSPFQQYPDLTHMNQEELEESLDSVDFSPSQMRKIIEAKDKNQTFIELYFWVRFSEVQQSVNDFHNYLVLNKIFLNKALFENFSTVDKSLMKALQERELSERYGEKIRPSQTFTKLKEEVTPLVEELESQIQERLHYSDTV